MISPVRSALLLKSIRPLAVKRFCSSTTKELRKDESKSSLKDTSSFVMNMFIGRTVLNDVFPYPVGLDDDRKEMLGMVTKSTEKFLREVNDPIRNDKEANIPMEVLTKFGELGAFGALVPEEYEGAGLNNVQMARLAEMIGASDLALGVVMGAHQSIGYKGILLYGNEQQKQKYLPDLATGRKFAAFCLTEPSTGSDANSVQTIAEKSADGKYFILNGGKLWISNGGFAEVFTVFAQTKVRDANGNEKKKVSAFIVERSFGGVTNGSPEEKMGIKGSNTAEVHFHDTKVPVENLLGEEGEGFKVAMNILNNGRFGIPAACSGSMKYCIQKTIEHTSDRVQFGKNLKEFVNVREQLSSMVTKNYASESITYLLAANMDKGIQDYQLEAAIAKVISSENAWTVCDQSIQLHGGMGFMKECGLERVLRDLRIFRIFEGANDVLRLFIALTGLQMAGKHLEMSFGKDKSMFSKFSEITRLMMARRSGDEDLKKSVHKSLRNSADLISESLNAFNKVIVTLLMKYKKGIIERQYELIRLANVAIEIYSMVAVLARCTKSSNINADNKHEQDIANLFCLQSSAVVQRNIQEIMKSNQQMELIDSIASNIYDSRSLVQAHPLDL